MADTVSDFISNLNPTKNLSAEDKSMLSQRVSGLITDATPIPIGIAVLLTPLIFVPALNDTFDLPKSLFFTVVALLALLLWLTKSARTGKINLISTIFDIPILLLVLATFISFTLSSDNRIPLLLANPGFLGSPGIGPILSVTAYIVTLFLLIAPVGGAIVFFLISRAVNAESTVEKLIKTALASGTILSLLSWNQMLYQIISSKLDSALLNSPFLNLNFSPVGSPLASAIILAALLPLGFGLFGAQKGTAKKITGVLTAVIALGLVATVYALFLNRPTLLDQNTGWKVATAVMSQSFQNALFGIGPNKYLDAFTAGKPVAFNASPYWNLRFTAGSNFYFFSLTTVGIAGLAAILFLTVRFTRLAQKRLNSAVTGPLEKGLIVSIALLLILFVFLPAPTTAVYLLFILLGLTMAYYKNANISAAISAESVSAGGTKLTIAIIATIAVTIASLFAGLGNLTVGSYYFRQSVNAASANRGTDTYNLQIQAIKADPWNESYHSSYSMTNLALANNLAGQQNLTDQQKQVVIQLVQQAIREGRIATALEPQRSSDWENLSVLYRNLINFAQGADQWAIAAQNQAIILDPANPRLRLDLGGIYFSLKDYQSAGQVFTQAVNLKGDYANAHYNLAQAEKMLKLNDAALKELQQAASLVCAASTDNNDCRLVTAEISSIAQENPPASPSALPSAGQTPLSTTSGTKSNLPNAATKPPVKLSSPSGEITP